VQAFMKFGQLPAHFLAGLLPGVIRLLFLNISRVAFFMASSFP
jgi:hypothetical protein